MWSRNDSHAHRAASMTAPTVNLAVTCAGGKSLAVPPSCRFREVADRAGPEPRATAWIERLKGEG